MSMPSHTHQGSEEELVFANESDRFVGVMGWQKPVIHMDGLCGAPAQNYKDYKVLLLVVSTHPRLALLLLARTGPWP